MAAPSAPKARAARALNLFIASTLWPAESDDLGRARGFVSVTAEYGIPVVGEHRGNPSRAREPGKDHHRHQGHRHCEEGSGKAPQPTPERKRQERRNRINVLRVRLQPRVDQIADDGRDDLDDDEDGDRLPNGTELNEGKEARSD